LGYFSHPWLYKKSMAYKIFEFPAKKLKIAREWKLARILYKVESEFSYFDSPVLQRQYFPSVLINYNIQIIKAKKGNNYPFDYLYSIHCRPEK
jgi:hypothetical protein